jgi:hypothetical protein
VEKFESALPTAANLVARGGRIALLIGSSKAETPRKILNSFAWSSPVLIPESSHRILLVGTKPQS